VSLLAYNLVTVHRSGELSRCSEPLQPGRSGDRIPVGGRDFPHTYPDRRWGPPSLLYNGYRVSFSGVK